MILCLVTAAVVVVGNAVKNRILKRLITRWDPKDQREYAVIQISDLHDSSYGEHNEDL